jgi:hypothetical protein
MLLGFRGAAEPTTVETQSAPPAVNQPVEEAPRLSAPVHQPAKTGDTVPRKIQPAAPATVELRLSNKAGADQKPIARKVGEIVYGRGDRVRGDRKEKKERQQRRRKGDNDDDH